MDVIGNAFNGVADKIQDVDEEAEDGRDVIVPAETEPSVQALDADDEEAEEIADNVKPEHDADTPNDEIPDPEIIHEDKGAPIVPKNDDEANDGRTVVINPDEEVDTTDHPATPEEANTEDFEETETLGIHGAEALSDEDLSMSDLLSLVQSIREKSSDTLNADDLETFDNAQALFETYKKHQQSN